MAENIYERLIDLSRRDSAAIYLNPPCDAACLERFRKRVSAELGADDADWYAAFLKTSNGAQFDNVIFDSAEELIENNLAFRTGENAERFIVFGKNGNTDRYVYDRERETKPFLVVDFYGDFSRAEEVTESFDSLADLIAFLIETESTDA